MHLFYDSTLNTWKLITEKLPEKPIDVQHIDFTHPIEGLKHVHIGGDPLAYENRLKKYNKAIAALKQNALTVGNPEICPQNMSAVEPGKLYEWPGGYKKWLSNVCSLTLPEEKKNTMENMTKEQAISKLWEDLSAIRDKYFLEEYYPSYWKIKEGFEHESQVIGDVLYFLDELTPSGSVAAPKEHVYTDKEIIGLAEKEIESLQSELAAAKESIKELYPFAERWHDTLEWGGDHPSGLKAIKEAVSRAKAILDKQ